MKVCSYCGHQNPDDGQFCLGCANNLPRSEIQSAEDTQPATFENDPIDPEIAAFRHSSLLSAGYFEKAEPVDISAIDMGYTFEEGFSYPDWKRIGVTIRETFPKEQWAQVWRELPIKWLDQLKEDLGGSYQQYESWNFLLLSAETKRESERILKMAEQVVESIETALGFITRQHPLYGKRVILLFSEQDDYYSYVSHYYVDGHYSGSGGMFIPRGYGHIAMPFPGIIQVAGVLIHELVHNCLMSLRIPHWLNEGLAVRIESDVSRSLSGNRAPAVILSRELAKEHHEYWNETNIQQFWAGSSFHQPDNGSRLSYNLSEIMVELLSENWKDFLVFVQNADPRDGGQDAALKCLDCCLGDTLARFLGPGEWRPNRKAIVDLWSSEKQAATDS